MLTTTKKAELDARLIKAMQEAEEGPTRELATVVREILETLPADGDHADAVRRVLDEKGAPRG